jgi:hypothetical protein
VPLDDETIRRLLPDCRRSMRRPGGEFVRFSGDCLLENLTREGGGDDRHTLEEQLGAWVEKHGGLMQSERLPPSKSVSGGRRVRRDAGPSVLSVLLPRDEFGAY